ncbi:maf protein [Parvibaculum lavamentivorans DS-1]|uniref:dTTP/UTP pyrophosphatase n=1 Tax=Parvibaculum lavamentivorans (strain DS-1 / DSM 13023 / NCIMB 13966) TaxID=402881 RepID=A7HQG7_PARL1|nr:Maf family nucleotide pyrophosphatase [Parvibaculum lavamentivorans]ABS62150.1 maf protein [Parvibaculum lavamentivorans DS-1]
MSENGAKPRLILASASPRRLALLEQIGIEPDLVLAADIDETPRTNELPRDHALRLAREKAQAIAALHPDALVLGADTVVACGRRILPKTETEEEARSCLALLSGRAHRVYTAVHLIAPNRVSERVCETRVTFKRLSPDETSAYLASGEWRGKAGGYAIQGRAALFVRALSGSHSSVVGLPLYETAALLAGAGFPVFSQS